MAIAFAFTQGPPARTPLEERSAALEAALQRAVIAHRRKNEFLATLAHELRNQLAPVLSSLEIMRRAHADADLRERACATMERQVLQMKRLADDLLDVRRIVRNQLEIRKAQVNLGVVLDQAIEASRPALEAAGRHLTVMPSSAPVFLEADAVRLTQVFSNLLVNACKYSDPGGRIDVMVEEQGSDVVVRVADDGIGIPPGLLPHVFERFVQGERTERAQGGLGIGLALAKQLVELHGGTVTALSEGVGRGSEFIVRLPTLTDRSPAGALRPEPAESFQASS